MYIIVNKTTGKNVIKVGDFPCAYLDKLLDEHNHIIVISLYSNTIKIPIPRMDHDGAYWDFVDFKLPIALIKGFGKQM